MEPGHKVQQSSQRRNLDQEYSLYLKQRLLVRIKQKNQDNSAYQIKSLGCKENSF